MTDAMFPGQCSMTLGARQEIARAVFARLHGRPPTTLELDQWGRDVTEILAGRGCCRSRKEREEIERVLAEARG